MSNLHLGQRHAGILAHVTSLPGRFGIGDLGPTAHAWVELLAQAGVSCWQVLPLGPTGYADSPYQCFSAFAGNPNLISPEALLAEGWLTPDDLVGIEWPDGPVDYASVIRCKSELTDRAYDRWLVQAPAWSRDLFEQFCIEQKDWLDDLALFLALKEVHGQRSWQDWPEAYRCRDSDALRQARRELAEKIRRHQFRQFLFDRQWSALREHAGRRGVELIGDMPIFVALDSADVWSNPELFLLDDQRRPRFQAGVPPDYFSATGQLWGHPLYDWSVHRATNYQWWAARLRQALRQVDWVRLDHFRGFESAWHVPAGEATAERGEWRPGPGAQLFHTLRRSLGRLPLIAEDLGVITPPVDQLRLELGLPGMRVLQFAFGGAVEDRFLPHHYDRATVVYTGTHDNDTTRGWYDDLSESERKNYRRYVPDAGEGPAWELIRLAWSSVAAWAIAPLQDLLELGSEARMNRPGTTQGNWRWRATSRQLADADWDKLAALNQTYQRGSSSPTPGHDEPDRHGSLGHAER